MPRITIWLMAAAMTMTVFGLAPDRGSAEPLPPFDEAARDGALLAFRSELIGIARARDLQALDRLMHPAIRTSFGGTGGKVEAIEAFRSQPELWPALADALARGGGFQGPDRFIAPYTALGGTTGDPFETLVVVGSDVNVRAAPSLRATVVGRLSHETAILAEGATLWPEDGWVQLTMPTGRIGYIHGDYVRSPLGFRAELVREGGRWQLGSFLAGD